MEASVAAVNSKLDELIQKKKPPEISDDEETLVGKLLLIRLNQCTVEDANNIIKECTNYVLQ